MLNVEHGGPQRYDIKDMLHINLSLKGYVSFYIYYMLNPIAPCMFREISKGSEIMLLGIDNSKRTLVIDC